MFTGASRSRATDYGLQRTASTKGTALIDKLTVSDEVKKCPYPDPNFRYRIAKSCLWTLLNHINPLHILTFYVRFHFVIAMSVKVVLIHVVEKTATLCPVQSDPRFVPQLARRCVSLHKTEAPYIRVTYVG